MEWPHKPEQGPILFRSTPTHRALGIRCAGCGSDTTEPVASMRQHVKRIIGLLTPAERRRGYLLLCMVVVMALLEMVGVATIMPFVGVLASPGLVETNPYLAAAYAWLGFEQVESFYLLLGFLVFTVLLVSISFKAFTTYILLRFTHLRHYSLSMRLASGYLRQPYEWFLNRHSADLHKTVLSEVQQVVTGALVPMMLLIAHGAVAVALLTLLIVVDPMLALTIAVVLGGAYLFIYMVLRRYLVRIGTDRVEANRQRYEALNEAFGGVKDVKVAGLEGVILKRFERPAKRFAQSQAASEIAGQLPRYALEIIAFGGMLGVILYLMIGSGGLDQVIPVIATYAFAGYRLMPALQQVYINLSRMRFAGPALAALHKDLQGIEALGEQGCVNHNPAPLVHRVGIRLNRVTYRYPETNRLALDSLTLDIPARTTVGLVGATGSGKTTAVDIMLGLLRPENGELLVDDEPITSKNVRQWQRTIGYVPQSIYLSDDTVSGNIAFGLPSDEVDPQAVERAARVANLHDFVISELPKGYETRVGERGVRLSGGQRQRIGIARALYHDPEVLIMDEATSALDNLTEQAVMEAVNNLGHRKTIILIAHRISTVRGCDRIFMLEKGRLVAQGPHAELLKSSAHFRTLVGSQG